MLAGFPNTMVTLQFGMESWTARSRGVRWVEQLVTESSESYKFPFPSQIITQKGRQAWQGEGKVQKKKIKKGNERREMQKAEGKNWTAQLFATEDKNKINYWAYMDKQDITTNLKRKGQRAKVILIVCDSMKC